MELIETLTRETLKVLAPPPRFTVSQWADAERRLSPESAAEPGRWNTDRAAFQRGPMDALNEDGVCRVVIMASAQVGKTELILNLLGYHVDYDPCPILVLQPTLDLAEAFSKDRLAPMLRDTPSIQHKVKDAKTRNSGNTLLQKKFPGGHITLAGANSPASLASRPIRLVLCDEVDRYPISAGAEGDPVKLAQKRATTFFNKIFVEVSTPTLHGVSRIEKSFEESDQRYFHVPCPLCGEKQKLTFDRFRWEKDENEEPVNVRYECIHCEGAFDDSKKQWMLLNGTWIAEKPFTGTAGFHIWEAYSPWVQWVEIVAESIKAEGDPEREKVFTNTSLGEVWKEGGEAPDWKRLYERREDYETNTIPDQVYFLTAGADVQKDRIEVEIVGWGRDKQNWSIDYRVFEGDTATDAPWKELDALLDEQWKVNGEITMGIKKLAVDSGSFTQVVYNWARRYPLNRVIATKGFDSLPSPIGQATPVDVMHNGRKLKKGCKMTPVGVSILKTELYSWLNLESPVDGAEYPKGYCHFPLAYESKHFKQLTAEQLKKVVVRGYPKFVWEMIYERNERLDCRVYARAAAASVGIDRFKDSQWDQMRPFAPPARATAPVAAAVPKSTVTPPASPKEKKMPEGKPRRKVGSIW